LSTTLFRGITGWPCFDQHNDEFVWSRDTSNGKGCDSITPKWNSAIVVLNQNL